MVRVHKQAHGNVRGAPIVRVQVPRHDNVQEIVMVCFHNQWPIRDAFEGNKA